MPRYLFLIEYKGCDFKGWARQPALNLLHQSKAQKRLGVQEHIERAFFQLTSESCILQASGRTDVGVHAYGQVAHFDTQKEYMLKRLLMGMNFHLEKFNIVIRAVAPVPMTLHARFSASRRMYHYYIWNNATPPVLFKNLSWHVRHPIDIEALGQAAEIFVGTHDFKHFRASDCQATKTLRTMDEIKVSRDLIYSEIIVITFSARSFLKQQVRRIIGAMVDSVLLKDVTACQLWLHGEKYMKKTYQVAPACGLQLFQVDYPEDIIWYRG